LPRPIRRRCSPHIHSALVPEDYFKSTTQRREESIPRGLLCSITRRRRGVAHGFRLAGAARRSQAFRLRCRLYLLRFEYRGLDDRGSSDKIPCSHSPRFRGLFSCSTPKQISVHRGRFWCAPRDVPGMPVSLSWNHGLIQTRLAAVH
jgi:hypothetical protein